jgi:hypothetical protein
MRRLILLGALGGLAACSGDTSLAIDAHCNPLGANACMTPWPSSAFEVDDPTRVTGRRLAIPDATLPANADELAADPTGWNVVDGFSPSAPIIMAFPGGVSPVGLPPVDNMDLSLAIDSPTVILDMTTGARVAHFAEVDSNAEHAPDSQALLLRPAARLVGGHRYAVAITNRVVAKDGSDLDTPPGFAALRDGKRTDHGLLEAMRPRFEDVLDALDEAGFPDDELVVAWDFTVASDAELHSDLVAARVRATAALGRPRFAVTAEAMLDGARRISGTLEAPLLLSNGGEARTGTRLVRDAVGQPLLQGSYRIPFTAVIPACAYRAATPVPMVVYGHGLLGDSREVAGNVQRAAAHELCMIFVGTDLRGMSAADLPAVARMFADLGRADEVFGVIVQGVIDHVTLVHAMRTVFADELFVDGSRRLAARDRVYYYGVSQGATLGATVMAYEPAIARGVLAVGGANYSMLLDRSSAWREYRALLRAAYPDPLDAMLAIHLFQMRWDRVESTGLVARQQLLQIAIGDDQIPNIASYWQARTMGIPLLGPSPSTPWGLTVRTGPLRSGSALVIMDGAAPLVPAANVPAVATGMHDLTRTQAAARRQIKRFFETGQIANECDGPCFCATGACD